MRYLVKIQSEDPITGMMPVLRRHAFHVDGEYMIANAVKKAAEAMYSTIPIDEYSQQKITITVERVV